MSIEKANVMTMADLPDHTAASQRPAAGNAGASAAEIKRGFSKVPTEAISPFDPYTAGGENTTGDPFDRGGFLGRPTGFQR